MATSTDFFLSWKLTHTSTKIINYYLADKQIREPRTYSQAEYEKTFKRLNRIYRHNKKIPDGLVNTWDTESNPGFIIYAADKEQFREYGDRVKKGMRFTDEALAVLVRSGKVVVIYPSTPAYHYTHIFEAYITKDRELYDKLRGVDVPESLIPWTGPIKAISCNPFKFGSQNIVIGSLDIIRRCPPLIQVLDTALRAINLFDTDGTINPRFLQLCSDQKLTSVELLLSSTSGALIQAMDSALYRRDPFWKTSDYSVYLDEVKVINKRKRSNRPVLGSSGVCNIRIETERGITDLVCFIDLPVGSVYAIKEPDIKDALKRLLMVAYFVSNIDTISFDVKVMVVKVVDIVVSPLPYVCGVYRIKLENGALWDKKNLVIICPKGGFKTTFRKMMAVHYPDFAVIDSDVYGRWLSHRVTDHEYKMTYEDLQKFSTYDTYPSYFEEIAACVINHGYDTEIERRTAFNHLFAKAIDSEVTSYTRFFEQVYTVIPRETFGRMVVMVHTTIEADNISGNNVHACIRPVHSSLLAVKGRVGRNNLVQEFLWYRYSEMTANTGRLYMSWAELLCVAFPDIVDNISRHFYYPSRAPLD
uniref:Uncharacterized protein n=1 Tax=French Guiana reovirus TaxID=2803189 RepID=A0A7T8G1Z2_9REOV|nr:hypothetical protein [French Guiana reovirus]